MGRHAIPAAALLLATLLGGCDHATTSVPTEHDFLGRIVAADVSAWETSDGGVSTGHLQSDYRVGPGVITLEDGTELVVPPDTPGGNMCVHLAEDRWDGGNPNLCFAVGQFVEGGSEVAWFGLVGEGQDLPRGHIRVTLHDVDSDEAVVDETGRLLRFPLADEIDLSGCADSPDLVDQLTELPRAAVHWGLLDVATGTIHGVECGHAV